MRDVLTPYNPIGGLSLAVETDLAFQSHVHVTQVRPRYNYPPSVCVDLKSVSQACRSSLGVNYSYGSPTVLPITLTFEYRGFYPGGGHFAAGAARVFGSLVAALIYFASPRSG